MKLSLLFVSALVATLVVVPASGEPIDGPVSGTVLIDPGKTLIQPMTLLEGVTEFTMVATGGDIDCGAFALDGEPISVDDREGVNACLFAVEAEDTVTIVIGVINHGTTVARVTAVAR